ncbi:hypothetical protein [Candidatus Nephthysia bennettiae]|uniref:hypothetical protein n=1 Tax=Candidatus Nephthysia bennettiae TaxID=3127016 RepID=UPI0030C769A1
MASPPDDDLVKDVFANYGLAAYLSHVLERSLVNALTTVYGPGPARLTEQQLELRFQELSVKGIGALLSTLRDAGLSTEVLLVVQGALEDRNRLVNHFFWDHMVDIATDEGCHRMLAELTEVEHRFIECDARVVEEVHRWAAAHGMTTTDFDAVQQATLERGRVLSGEEVDEVLGSSRQG